MLGFLLFYKHKIKSSIDYLREKNSIGDVPQNELGEACTLIQKRFRELEHTQIRLKIQQDNFEHLLSTFAHDINNPLTVVKGNVELLGMISETDKKMEQEVLESLEYNLERIENYTKRLEKLIVFDNLDLNLRSVSVKKIEKFFSKSSISFPVDKSLEWEFTHSSAEMHH
ncbi:histidine kinase dimerization/phospho-acceptor domain-containing protein [Anaeromonas gelatinilytica]|uniref:histidine kinase dimerization/phospho-acceptor domain-containing protein n=1 Tax=Anaeromonas gelatinilytica TaxID=2683194 RepID=UPI002078FE56|nr:histidine kinase dimerization/phospho-acceptor domain-containing protein [Anaeromonas gelatinilytica]